LQDYIRSGRIQLDRTRYPQPAAYHDPCNYGRKALKWFGHGYFEEPRWIMDQCLTDWVDLAPNRLYQTCCGGGGGTMTTGYDEERLYYGRRKIEQIKSAGVNMVVVPCHSCHGQINSLKTAHDMPDLQVKYLWEVVADILVL
jgi:Fe-S oxidoreductase